MCPVAPQGWLDCGARFARACLAKQSLHSLALAAIVPPPARAKVANNECGRPCAGKKVESREHPDPRREWLAVAKPGPAHSVGAKEGEDKSCVDFTPASLISRACFGDLRNVMRPSALSKACCSHIFNQHTVKANWI